MSTQVSIIAIVARDRAIGRGGDQPFHISADFARFKALTMGKPIVMGRRTFEALPKGALPGRRNIVVSRNEEFHPRDAERVSSLNEALALCADAGELMIIGGGQIYEAALPLATTLYLTEVDAEVPDADTYFPQLTDRHWMCTDINGPHVDPRSGATYNFCTYRPLSD